jgi:hypothetical protein
VSLTTTAMMCGIRTRAKAEAGSPRGARTLEWMVTRYETSLRWAIRSPAMP